MSRARDLAFGALVVGFWLGTRVTWAAAADACDVKAVKRQQTVETWPGPTKGFTARVTIDATRCPHLRDGWTWLVFREMADGSLPRDPVVVKGDTPEPALAPSSTVAADDGTLVLHLSGTTALTLVAIPPGQEGVRGLHLAMNTLSLRGVVAREILIDGGDAVDLLDWAGVGAAATLDARKTRRLLRGAPVRAVRLVTVGDVSFQREVPVRRVTPTFGSAPPEGDFPVPVRGDARGT